ncbi:MAG: ATP-binding protein [Desulfobacteraceae bacterium]|nr:ATP-binding protein [Desulfobacteraceae bacterium]MBC2720736.1 ATP-binding protein [Desulfobacteraceae bacterium]
MKNLPIGIQTFRDIVQNDYLYVDKTEKIFDLVKNPKGVYFLARPRRFGKSLLISILNEIFEGNKNLFKGLWIYEADYTWEKYPVVRIDFSKKKAENKDGLKAFILNQLKNIGNKYGISLDHDQYDEAFDELLIKLGEINKVVVLIDEYDKLIIDNIENKNLAVEFREILKGFYTIIKACDEHIRFILLTGVSKFSKAGVFSGLNNLEDISMDARHSSLLGITRQEMESCFKEYIELFAKSEVIKKSELIKKIIFWYNGFCFSGSCEKVFNPFSALLLFQKLNFGNYWFESATPSFLIKLIKKKNFDLKRLDGVKVSESAFSSYEIENLKIMPILFQTGYLTITGYNKERMEYTLAYPNFEVKNSMTECLAEVYSFVERELVHGYAWKLIDALRDHDYELFFDTLRVFFANIPYDLHIEREKYYQTVFYLIFSLIGLKVEAEVRTNKGRIDAVIMDKDVHVFEFKFEKDKDKALSQIKGKRYFEKYQNAGKDVYLFGVEFKDRNVGEWVVEKIN